MIHVECRVMFIRICFFPEKCVITLHCFKGPTRRLSKLLLEYCFCDYLM